LTSKVKAALVLALLVAIGAGGFLAGWRIKSHLCREAELEIILSEEERKRALAEKENISMRRAMAAFAEEKQRPPAQKSTWRKKSSGKKLTEPPPGCEHCLRQVKREVEVRDEAQGWWIYKDPDVLDEAPGTLTLTPLFFTEAVAPAGADLSGERSTPDTPPPPSHPSIKKPALSLPEKSVRAGIGLAAYELEFGYDPVLINGRRADVSFGMRSRLSVDRFDSTLKGDLSAGVEFRW
jgi:hypothetical protein